VNLNLIDVKKLTYSLPSPQKNDDGDSITVLEHNTPLAENYTQ